MRGAVRFFVCHGAPPKDIHDVISTETYAVVAPWLDFGASQWGVMSDLRHGRAFISSSLAEGTRVGVPDVPFWFASIGQAGSDLRGYAVLVERVISQGYEARVAVEGPVLAIGEIVTAPVIAAGKDFCFQFEIDSSTTVVLKWGF